MLSTKIPPKMVNMQPYPKVKFRISPRELIAKRQFLHDKKTIESKQ